MLSRASILSAQQLRAIASTSLRTISTTPILKDADTVAKQNRLVRQEPGKVRLGFLPEEWFTFFYKKTGVTGPYTFFFTFGTYLVSKEIYILEHDFYNGLAFAIMWIIGVKKFGPKIAAYLDKEIDAFEQGWNDGREQEKSNLQKGIEEEKKSQWSMEGQSLLVQAKRENVALQLEAAYRQRVATVVHEVTRRLDYQLERQNIERRLKQKNLVDYVVSRVRAAITPDQEKQNIDKCIIDLAALGKA